MILRLSEITKGTLQDAVQDYILNLKILKLLCKCVFFYVFKKRIFVDLPSLLCKKGTYYEVKQKSLKKIGKKAMFHGG